jgi:hypothetical protein
VATLVPAIHRARSLSGGNLARPVKKFIADFEMLTVVSKKTTIEFKKTTNRRF